MGEVYLAQFEPFRDSGEWVNEDPYDYSERMQSTLLPEWPTEVLIEWLHRHAGHVETYADLGYENFRFRKESWPLTRIPGREAFADPKFCDGFSNVKKRAQNPKDWLAIYMETTGTWNTPVIFLETPTEQVTMPGGWKLRYPLHLLEGHRRLSFLNGLKARGKALPEHDVWLVSLAAKRNNTT